jgi:hypothetical protein
MLVKPVAWDLVLGFSMGLEVLLLAILNLMEKSCWNTSNKCRRRMGECPAECIRHSICIKLGSRYWIRVCNSPFHLFKLLFWSRSLKPKFYNGNTQISVTWILMDGEFDLDIDIWNSNFRDFHPTGQTVVCCSQQLWSSWTNTLINMSRSMFPLEEDCDSDLHTFDYTGWTLYCRMPLRKFRMANTLSSGTLLVLNVEVDPDSHHLNTSNQAWFGSS